MSDRRENVKYHAWINKKIISDAWKRNYENMSDAISTRHFMIMQTNNLIAFGINRINYNHSHRKLKGWMKTKK